ncbi:MAG: baseplate J/gp47 family protein [Chitinophagaceae bacterium]|nr:baseplate J/gp47 family protein [Chitinophagaceae bacterium]
MAIRFPESRKEVVDRAKSDVNTHLPQSNAFLKNSYLGALIVGYAGRVYEFYLQLKNALLEMFPDTATGSYLERWGSYVGINRLAPTPSQGYIVFTGLVGSTVPAGTSLSDSAGNTYITQDAGVISTASIAVTSLTRTGVTALALTSIEHGLATGMSVSMGGAVETAYNGVFSIVVTSPTSFTYTVSGSPSSPATGSVTVNVPKANILVESTLTGSSSNQEGGTELTLNVALTGVDSTALCDFYGFTGGTDTEEDSPYRQRVLYRYQNPITLFNESAIKQEVLKVNGVTRVFVRGPGDFTGQYYSVSSITRTGSLAIVTMAGTHNLEDGQSIQVLGATPVEYNGTHRIIVLSPTSVGFAVDSGLVTPATGTITYQTTLPAGQVAVFFMRDGDLDPIPSYSSVVTVNNVVQAIRPAHTSPDDVIVKAPLRSDVAFVFTALSPNTATMRAAIEDALRYTFVTNGTVAGTIPQAAYLSAIWQAVSATGEVVSSFTLASPTGDLTAAADSIFVVSTITWPS